MPQIQLEEQLFQAAQRRAADGGYASVDEYIADVVVQDISEDADNFDHLFTTDKIAELDRISTEIKAGGKTYSMAEADEILEKVRQEWLAKYKS